MTTPRTKHPNPRGKAIGDREHHPRQLDELQATFSEEIPIDELMVTQSTDTKNMPPRPGYSQRWVRHSTMGTPDNRNVAQKMQLGWKPRSAETLPADAFVQTVHFGPLGTVIGNDEMILMEIPTDRLRKIYQVSQNRADRQQAGVNNQMFAIRKPGDAFGRPQVYDLKRSSSIGGRSVRVAEDKE